MPKLTPVTKRELQLIHARNLENKVVAEENIELVKTVRSLQRKNARLEATITELREEIEGERDLQNDMVGELVELRQMRDEYEQLQKVLSQFGRRGA